MTNLMLFVNGWKILSATKGLVNNLLFDQPLTWEQRQDFGVESANHYRALRGVVMYEPPGADLSFEEIIAGLKERVMALDEAHGNGEKLTRLVQKYAPQYKLTFLTYSDFCSLESED